MPDFEDTWPSGHDHTKCTGRHLPDPRPFWTPVVLAIIVIAALAAVFA